MSETRETRLIIISPDSDIAPDRLVRSIHALGKDITAKETCYGSVIEGRRDDVRFVLNTLRETAPNEIFSKVRAYPAGDPRRCRAQHGSRPGFSQIEEEWKDLSKIRYALEHMDECKISIKKEKNKLSVNEFKKICEARP